MYSIGITIAFCILAGFAHGEGEVPEMATPPPENVVVGSRVTMKCTVNQGALFMASKALFVVHKSISGENVISNQGNLLEEYSKRGFSINFDFNPQMSVEITINEVTADLDGQYFCRVRTITPDQTLLGEVSAPMRVLAGVERVEMTVENTVVARNGQELSFRAGQISVGCISYGSNPEANIHLSIGDTMIHANVTSVEDPDSSLPRRSYKGQITHMLDFNHKMFDKQLTCHAETLLPEWVTADLPDASISAVLKGIVDEPVVFCTNNSATISDKHTTLTCLVSKTPKVKRLYFNVGNEFQIYPGNRTKDLITCELKDLNTTHEEIVLSFYEMKDWHFTVNIYLDVLGYDGSTFQYPVYLNRDRVSKGTAVVPTILVIAVSLIAAVFSIKSP